MTNPNDPVYTTNGAAKSLTKREYFAAMALQGLCVDACNRPYEDGIIQRMAQSSVVFADALIEALNKENNQ